MEVLEGSTFLNPTLSTLGTTVLIEHRDLTPGCGHIDQDILFLLEDTEKGIAQLETDLVDLPACSSREESFPDRVALLVLWVDKVCLESQPGSDGWLRGRAALTRLHSLSDSYASVVLAKPGVITKKSRLPSF